MIRRHILAKAIAERTMHVKDGSRLKDEIAAYLLHERSTVNLGSLMRDVLSYRVEAGLIEAVVVSAYPLDEVVRKDVVSLLREEYPRAKSITLSEKLDSNVVGGIRIEMPERQLDLTVRAKLNTLKRLTGARN